MSMWTLWKRSECEKWKKRSIWYDDGFRMLTFNAVVDKFRQIFIDAREGLLDRCLTIFEFF